MDILANVEISYDHEYKAKLNEKIRAKYGTKVKRTATHVSDLIGCLRAGWAKKHIPEDQWLTTEIGADDDPYATWVGGLLFEEFVSEGEKQKVSAYCFSCRVVSSVPNPIEGEDGQLEEVAECTSCGARWLIGTPDWIEDGVIHEAKQTRKSRKGLPQTTPWYLEQVVSYMLFAHRRGGEAANWSRIVAETLMADYKRAKKGERPIRPLSQIDPFRVAYIGAWQDWEDELSQRKSIVEGDEVPPLTGMPGGYRSPAYAWNCGGCEVGLVANDGEPCENYPWDTEGKRRDEEEAIDLPPPTSAQKADTEAWIAHQLEKEDGNVAVQEEE